MRVQDGCKEGLSWVYKGMQERIKDWLKESVKTLRRVCGGCMAHRGSQLLFELDQHCLERPREHLLVLLPDLLDQVRQRHHLLRLSPHSVSPFLAQCINWMVSKKTTPPQNRQLNMLISNSKQ